MGYVTAKAPDNAFKGRRAKRARPNAGVRPETIRNAEAVREFSALFSWSCDSLRLDIIVF